VNQVPLCSPDVGAAEMAAIERVFETGALSHGPEVRGFEDDVAGFIGTSRAVALNSWTSAAFLACSYVRETCGPGEVLLPSYTFVASANVIENAGLKPRFVDVDWHTHNVTVEALRDSITSETVALMPVHFAGTPCDMPAIMDLATKHGLRVLEDSAECLGAHVGGCQAGSFDIGLFSLYATKNMTTGEGGIVTTNDHELADWINLRAAHGVMKGSYSRDGESRPWFRNATATGHNFRLSNFQAAMGRVQLSKIKEMNHRRRQVALRYHSRLSSIPTIELPPMMHDGEQSFQMFVIKVPPDLRDEVVLTLNERGIGASVHFDPPVHEQTAYRDTTLDLPMTVGLSRTAISLPISSVQTPDETDYVIEQLLELLP
jgi:perosamine synthetase